MAGTKKALGKAHRKGLSLKAIMRQFPDDAAAETWFIQQRWPQGICCPYCGSVNVQTGCKHKTMPFRCREKACASKFSVRTHSVMERSKIGYQDWLVAMFLVTTHLKGVSSMKLHRDLGITQKSAWFLAQRLRKALAEDGKLFRGPLVDETYFGGTRKNMSNAKREELAATGRGAVGKTAVVGAKDRATNQVVAKVVPATDKGTLQGFVQDNADPDATVYTDDAAAYETLAFKHDTVKHSLQEYVQGEVHTNGIESLWNGLSQCTSGVEAGFSPVVIPVKCSTIETYAISEWHWNSPGVGVYVMRGPPWDGTMPRFGARLFSRRPGHWRFLPSGRVESRERALAVSAGACGAGRRRKMRTTGGLKRRCTW